MLASEKSWMSHGKKESSWCDVSPPPTAMGVFGGG